MVLVGSGALLGVGVVVAVNHYALLPQAVYAIVAVAGLAAFIIARLLMRYGSPLGH